MNKPSLRKKMGTGVLVVPVASLCEYFVDIVLSSVAAFVLTNPEHFYRLSCQPSIYVIILHHELLSFVFFAFCTAVPGAWHQFSLPGCHMPGCRLSSRVAVSLVKGVLWSDFHLELLNPTFLPRPVSLGQLLPLCL